MSIRTKILIGILSLAGSSAMADATQSEFFYQTAAGKTAGTIQAGYQDRELKTNNGTQKDTGLTHAGLRYEMGLNDVFSVEGVISYSLLTENPASSGTDNGTLNGLDNVQLNIKATNGSYSWGRLRYGAYNSIGIIPAQYNLTSNGNNTAFNGSTGNYTFTPYLGADFDVGPGIFGGKVSYDLVKTDSVFHGQNGQSSLLYQGGQDLSASLFYEWLMDQSLLGIAVNYTYQGPANTLAGVDSGFGVYGAKIYGRWGFADAWSIIPSVQYNIYANKNAVDMYSSLPITSGTELNVNVAARYAF